MAMPSTSTNTTRERRKRRSTTLKIGPRALNLISIWTCTWIGLLATASPTPLPSLRYLDLELDERAGVKGGSKRRVSSLGERRWGDVEALLDLRLERSTLVSSSESESGDQRAAFYHFGSAAEEECSEGTVVCFEDRDENENDKRVPLIERDTVLSSTYSCDEVGVDTLLLTSADVQIELKCSKLGGKTRFNQAWKSASILNVHRIVGESGYACLDSSLPIVRLFTKNDQGKEEGEGEEGLVDDGGVPLPTSGRKTTGIVLSSFGLITIVVGLVAYRPPSFLRRHRKTKTSLKRTGEGNLVRWAEEDMGLVHGDDLEEEEDVMVNGGIASDEDNEVDLESNRAVYDEYIPLRPSPRKLGHGGNGAVKGKFGFRDYGSASVGW